MGKIFVVGRVLYRIIFQGGEHLDSASTPRLGESGGMFPPEKCSISQSVGLSLVACETMLCIFSSLAIIAHGSYQGGEKQVRDGKSHGSPSSK